MSLTGVLGIIVSLLLVVGGTAPVHAAEDDAVLRVSLVQGRLSINAKDVPVLSILDRIGRLGGFRIRFDDVAIAQSHSDLTTIALTAVPIEEALRRILRDKDFVLTYGGGRIVEIRVYGALEPRSA
jgi:hypothetical protein